WVTYGSPEARCCLPWASSANANARRTVATSLWERKCATVRSSWSTPFTVVTAIPTPLFAHYSDVINQVNAANVARDEGSSFTVYLFDWIECVGIHDHSVVEASIRGRLGEDTNHRSFELVRA